MPGPLLVMGSLPCPSTPHSALASPTTGIDRPTKTLKRIRRDVRVRGIVASHGIVEKISGHTCHGSIIGEVYERWALLQNFVDA